MFGLASGKILLRLQENEAVQEEKKKQLYEEGIDAILARAEVRATQPQQMKKNSSS